MEIVIVGPQTVGPQAVGPQTVGPNGASHHIVRQIIVNERDFPCHRFTNIECVQVASGGLEVPEEAQGDRQRATERPICGTKGAIQAVMR